MYREASRINNQSSQDDQQEIQHLQPHDDLHRNQG
jgi:hypothetical protein